MFIRRHAAKGCVAAASLPQALLPRLPLDNIEHGLGVGSFFERLPKFLFVQQLGDLGERVEMLLKLALGNEEEHDERDRLVVERVEVDALLRPAKGANDFTDQVGRGVRNANAKPDARAHGSLSLL